MAAGSAVALFMSLTTIPSSAVAQVSDAAFHGTLGGWDESTWLLILDRNAATGGRLSSYGILQRFNEDIDSEYVLDRLAANFTLTEDFEWYQLRDDGVRWTGGSITKRDLAIETQFKTKVPLGSAWSFTPQFDQRINPTTNRNLVRVAFAHRWQNGLNAFARGSLDPNKPDSDLELGAGWESKRGRHKASLSLAVLDWANDLIYVGLEAARQSQIDSTLEYEKQPLALHATFVTSLGRSVRLEGYGAIMRPATILQYHGSAQDEGIRQSERFSFAGGMVEWALDSKLRLGFFGTYVRAETERTALAPELGVDEYELTEQTTNLGGFALVRVARTWHVELLLARNWRPEERVFQDSANTNVDYLDQAWTGQLLLVRSTPKGFQFDLALMMDRRRVVRGDRQVPSAGTLGGNNYRARFDAGWRFSDQFACFLGAGMDVDGDGVGRYFGGARGRFTVYW